LLEEYFRDVEVINMGVGGFGVDQELIPLSNPKLRLPGDLAHLNESGNGVLAWEIAQFLRTNQLIPVQHSSDHQS
jgi:hypothetical protein